MMVWIAAIDSTYSVPWSCRSGFWTENYYFLLIERLLKSKTARVAVERGSLAMHRRVTGFIITIIIIIISDHGRPLEEAARWC